jgi:hypothetical protein
MISVSMPKTLKAKKKYVSVIRGCNFYDLCGFNTFQLKEKTYIYLIVKK